MQDIRPSRVSGGAASGEPEPRRCWSCSKELPIADDGTLILWAEGCCKPTGYWQYCPFNVE